MAVPVPVRRRSVIIQAHIRGHESRRRRRTTYKAALRRLTSCRSCGAFLSAPSTVSKAASVSRAGGEAAAESGGPFERHRRQTWFDYSTAGPGRATRPSSLWTSTCSRCATAAPLSW
eukprot:1675700-Prymnesium_polylepis.2